MPFKIRIAAAQANPEDEGLSKGQMAAMGVAAASPFAGLIGQDPIIHDPLQGAKGQKFKDMKELARSAQPGDILLGSKPKGSLFKEFITPAGGSQFYHAQPVVGRSSKGPRGMGTTISAGDSHGSGMSAKDVLEEGTYKIPDYMKSPETYYSDAVLLRPKTPLTPEQVEQLQHQYAKRSLRQYDDMKAVGTLGRELFVPKIDALNKLRPETVCEGNVCSTMPAMAMHDVTGQKVVPGKASQDVFPTDFLRSKNYELIGSHTTPETRALEKSFGRRVGPYAMRAGIGAGLAAGTYGVSEDPALAAGLGGAVATDYLLDKSIKNKKMPKKLQKYFPTFWDAGQDILGGSLDSQAVKNQRLRRFFGGRVPALLAGGAAAYGGAKALGAGVEAAREKLDM